MSVPINDGGSAFPGQPKDAQGYPIAPMEYGMSLRDWFAGQALTGLLPQPAEPEYGPLHFAKASYAMADAMIEARNQINS